MTWTMPVGILISIFFILNEIILTDTIINIHNELAFEHKSNISYNISSFGNPNMKTSSNYPSNVLQKYNKESYNLLISSNDSYLACAQNYRSIQGKCYIEFHSEIITWVYAIDSCKKYSNGNLAGKPQGNWRAWVNSLKLPLGAFLWVNIHKTQKGWFWSADKQPVVEWVRGQPDGSGGDDACAALRRVGKALYEVSCSGRSGYDIVTGYICETPPIGICNKNGCKCFKEFYGKSCLYECTFDCIWPFVCIYENNITRCACHEGSIETNGICTSLVICPTDFSEIFSRCYKKFDHEIGVSKNWNDSNTACAELYNGMLAVPPLSAWNIWTKLMKLDEYGIPYWINLEKTASGWHWPTGNEVQQWAPGQPDGSAGDDACAAIYPSVYYRLHEYSCTKVITNYICEAPRIGCVNGYFGPRCRYGLSLRNWLIVCIISISGIIIISLIIYILWQKRKYKLALEYSIISNPRGHCVIMYTRENIYLSQVDFTPDNPDNLTLHKGQILQSTATTGHKDILYGKSLGDENEKEGYFITKHVKQSEYGLADADLCSKLWKDINFIVHKIEVTSIEDFHENLIKFCNIINADTRKQDCFVFTFIGHGFMDDKTEFINLNGHRNENESEHSSEDLDNIGNIESEKSINGGEKDGYENFSYICNEKDNKISIRIEREDCIAQSNNIENSDNKDNMSKSLHISNCNTKESMEILDSDEKIKDVFSNERKIGFNNEDYIHSVGYPVKLIYEHFISQNCPRLLGVPKLFYIQACRGDKVDSPACSFDENYKICKREIGQAASVPKHTHCNENTLQIDTLGTYSDILVFCSSFSGYFSYFQRKEGRSFFIEEIVKVYSKDHKKHTLSEMNSKVKDTISKINIPGVESREKQVPTISVDTLRKKVQF